MERHFVRIEDGDCVIEGAEGLVTIGRADAVVEAIGGEEYAVEYDDETSSSPWLATDPDGTLTVEVRSAMDELPLPEDVYDQLSERDSAAGGPDSERVRYFAAVLTAIWDSKGGIEPEELSDVGKG
jgi:hypothetical protein